MMKLKSLLVALSFCVMTGSHAALVSVSPPNSINSATSTKQTPECGVSCTWSISVDGNSVAAGSFVADPDSGALSGGSERVELGAGAWVQLTNLFGNIDPILGFSTAAGTGALGKTFAFNFSLPIALTGPLLANSSVSYSLTSTTAAGAQISPLFGKAVIAQEVDTTVGGLSPLNKGVDVGNIFGFVGGPQTQNSPVYTANATLTGNLAYDLMSVTVAFALSPNSNVGLSGFVQQEPAGGGVGTVPLPGAAWLLFTSLLGMGGLLRRPRT